MQPEARNCSRGFGIKYIHVCLCDPLLQYGGIVGLLKRNPKKTPENREDEQSAKQFSLNAVAIFSRCVWHCSQYKSFFGDLQNGCKIHFWPMSRVKHSRVAVACAIYYLFPVNM